MFWIPFRITSPSGYVNIETMNIISSDVGINEHELLVNKSNGLITVLKKLVLPHFSELVNQLAERKERKIC